MRPLFAVVTAASLAALSACTTYKDDLARSQHAFEANEHERALAVLRMLEPDMRHLDDTERAHYCYLRGMTDYRIGYKADARHWLALARALDEAHPGLLPQDWRARADESLTTLDAQVHAGGFETLSNSRHRPAPKVKAPAESPEPAAQDEEEEEEQPANKPPPKKKKKPLGEDEE